MFILIGFGSVDFLFNFIIGVVILICVLDFEVMFVYYFIVIVSDLNGGVVILSFNVIVVN